MHMHALAAAKVRVLPLAELAKVTIKAEQRITRCDVDPFPVESNSAQPQIPFPVAQVLRGLRPLKHVPHRAGLEIDQEDAAMARAPWPAAHLVGGEQAGHGIEKALEPSRNTQSNGPRGNVRANVLVPRVVELVCRFIVVERIH